MVVEKLVKTARRQGSRRPGLGTGRPIRPPATGRRLTQRGDLGEQVGIALRRLEGAAVVGQGDQGP
jgi:hypothetical protein